MLSTMPIAVDAQTCPALLFMLTSDGVRKRLIGNYADDLIFDVNPKSRQSGRGRP